MYSPEIENILRSQNNNIENKTYLHIFNTSPQISHVKYNPYENKFEVWTNDNYYWKFGVYRKE